MYKEENTVKSALATTLRHILSLRKEQRWKVLRGISCPNTDILTYKSLNCLCQVFALLSLVLPDGTVSDHWPQCKDKPCVAHVSHVN